MTTRKPLYYYLSLIDWNALSTLTLLVLVTEGMKESGFFECAAFKIVRRVKTERGIAFALILLGLLLPMVLMNDTTVFILVPITLSVAQYADLPADELVSLEVIAVNLGSSLTPIGNPQNIVIWHYYSVSVLKFVVCMFPCVAVSSLLLVTYILRMFKPVVTPVKLQTAKNIAVKAC